MIYLLGFAIAFAISLAITPLMRRYAVSHGVVDRPGGRKAHGRPVAYLGGVAIFVGFVVAALMLMTINKQLAALLVGCAVLAVLGAIDDIRPLSPLLKFAVQFFAAGIALAGGIGITSITNPFGGVIDLSYGRFAVDLFGWHFHIAPIANAVSLIWMVGLANTINFLDGVDGLACGVSAIAAIVVFLLSVGPMVDQPAVALLAIIVAGAALGFLPYNFFPAKIFMGDSGALFLGLVLAMLAIYSGAKLATALLVLGFPIFDAVAVAVRRVISGKMPWSPDRTHFHHLLLSIGLSQREVVLFYYAITIAFGLLALISNSYGKLLSLIGLLAALLGMMASLLVFGWLRKKKQN